MIVSSPALPNILQWNRKLCVTIHHALNFTPICISPAALVITKCEILLHSRIADSALLICCRNCWLCWSGKEIQVNTTTELSPCDVRRTKQYLLAMSNTIIDAVGVRNVVTRSIRYVGGIRKDAGASVYFIVSRIQVERVGSVNVVINRITRVCGVYRLQHTSVRLSDYSKPVQPTFVELVPNLKP